MLIYYTNSICAYVSVCVGDTRPCLQICVSWCGILFRSDQTTIQNVFGFIQNYVPQVCVTVYVFNARTLTLGL